MLIVFEMGWEMMTVNVITCPLLMTGEYSDKSTMCEWVGALVEVDVGVGRDVFVGGIGGGGVKRWRARGSTFLVNDAVAGSAPAPDAAYENVFVEAYVGEDGNDMKRLMVEFPKQRRR